MFCQETSGSSACIVIARIRTQWDSIRLQLPPTLINYYPEMMEVGPHLAMADSKLIQAMSKVNAEQATPEGVGMDTLAQIYLAQAKAGKLKLGLLNHGRTDRCWGITDIPTKLNLFEPPLMDGDLPLPLYFATSLTHRHSASFGASPSGWHEGHLYLDSQRAGVRVSSAEISDTNDGHPPWSASNLFTLGVLDQNVPWGTPPFSGFSVGGSE